MKILVKPELNDDEVFFPLNEDGSGLIVPIDGLLRVRGKVLTDVNQYEAMKTANEYGGFVLSVAEDRRLFAYARAHQNPRFKKYLEKTTNPEYARYCSTQVHNLQSDCPIIVDLRLYKRSRVAGPDFDTAIEYPWLPKTSGDIARIDKKTGFPRKLGEDDIGLGYYDINHTLDIAAAIRSRLSGPSLGLCGDPSLACNVLGISFAKRFLPKSLEEKTQ